MVVLCNSKRRNVRILVDNWFKFTFQSTLDKVEKKIGHYTIRVISRNKLKETSLYTTNFGDYREYTRLG